MTSGNTSHAKQVRPTEAVYEGPRVEAVLSAEELEREVTYAGASASPEPAG